jgi:LacI family transcriptional regulator
VLGVELEHRIRVDRAARIPLATQMAQQIRWLITAGQIPAGRLLPPVRNLAAQLGVNQHTVRAAYQQLARDGLAEARPGRGTTVLPYDPERLAAAAPGVPTFVVGVVVPNFSPFYRPFLDGIEDSGGGPTFLFVGSAREDPERGLRYLDRLLARGVDGVIVAAAMLPEREARSRQRAFPRLVFADWPGGPGPSIDFDLEEATFQGTRHLLEHGHTRIGLIAPAPSLPNVFPRYTGYLRALADAGLAPARELQAVTADFTVGSGRDAAQALLCLPRPPTAVVTVGDLLAVGAYQAAHRMGWRVPADLAIVGGDGTPDVALDPPLTTVALPAKEMGMQAMEMLQLLITGRSPRPRRRILQPQLITAGSCGCAG